MPTFNGQPIHDLSRCSGTVRVPAEQRAATRKCLALLLERLRKQQEVLELRIRHEAEAEEAAAMGVNIHLLKAGFDVGELVDVRGDIYRVGDEGEAASYVGASIPDDEEEEPGDEVAEHAADYRRSVATNA